MGDDDDDYDWGDDDDDDDGDIEEMDYCDLFKHEAEVADWFKEIMPSDGCWSRVLACYLVNKDGKKAARSRGMVCSASFRTVAGLPFIPGKFYHSLWYHPLSTTYEDALKYWKFLFNKKWSPWREIVKHARMIKGKDGKYSGFVFDTVDVPYQAFMNFLIATRMPYEFPSKIKLFNHLISNGIPRYGALYWMAYFGINNMGNLKQEGNLNHLCFDSYSVKSLCVAKLKAGYKWEKDASLYPVTKRYLTYNTIWHNEAGKGGSDTPVLWYKNIFEPESKKQASPSRFTKLRENTEGKPSQQLVSLATFTKRLKEYSKDWRPAT